MTARIKRIEQEDDASCGIACVAMIAGMTYLQAKRFFDDRVFQPKDRKPRTRHYQLCRALFKLGIPSKKRLFRKWCLIENLSIIPINRRSDTGWHWILFVPDRVRPYVLDPMPGKGCRRYDFRGIKARGYYIAIATVR